LTNKSHKDCEINDRLLLKKTPALEQFVQHCFWLRISYYPFRDRKLI